MGGLSSQRGLLTQLASEPEGYTSSDNTLLYGEELIGLTREGNKRVQIIGNHGAGRIKKGAKISITLKIN